MTQTATTRPTTNPARALLYRKLREARRRKPFHNGLGLTMVPVPAGEFPMGTTDEERQALRDAYRGQEQLPWVALWLEHLDNEGPAHEVRFTEDFHMSAHEVTVGQWETFVRNTGYLTEAERSAETGVQAFGLDLCTGQVQPQPWYNWRFWLRENAANPSGFVQRPDHPVVCVSWEDAREFCRWLSEKEGRTYRLPTEAEWEYACRAGGPADERGQDFEDTLRRSANIADTTLQRRWTLRFEQGGQEVEMPAPPYAVPWSDEFPFLAPVGRFEPNAWGFHDMRGNGGEWCLDWYAPYEDFVPPGKTLDDPVFAPDDPPTVEVGAVIPGAPPMPLRVIRGGVWLDPAFGFRCTGRETHRRHPVQAAADIGFRVVASEVDPQPVSPKAKTKAKDKPELPKGEGREDASET